MILGCLSPFLAARSTMWGIVEAFGGLLPRFYPLVVPDLRIVVLEWIRELVHGRVVFVDRGRLSRSRSSSC